MAFDPNRNNNSSFQPIYNNPMQSQGNNSNGKGKKLIVISVISIIILVGAFFGAGMLKDKSDADKKPNDAVTEIKEIEIYNK